MAQEIERLGAQRHEPPEPTDLPRPRRLSWAVGVPLLALVYFASARIGLSLATVAEQVSPVWPPTGIALAAVLWFGPGGRAWAGVALGAFLANIIAHEPLGSALGIAAGNTLEAVLGAWLLRRWLRGAVQLSRLRHVLAFIILAAGVSTAVSATIGVTSLCLGGVHPWAKYGTLWSVWWLGDATGALVLAPVLITWLFDRVSLKPARIAEAAALAVGLFVTCVGVFIASQPHQIGHLPPAYAVFPFIIWAAVRFGPRETSTAIFVASSFAIWGALQGLGPFGRELIADRLVYSQNFMAVVAVTGMVLAAVVSDRHRSASDLWRQREWLRVTLSSIDDAVIVTDVSGRVSFMNPAAEQLSGSRAAVGLELSHAFQLVSEPDRRPLENLHTQVLREGRVTGEGRHTLLVRRDGLETMVEESGAPIRDAEGQVTGVVLVFRDVADRRRAEDVMRRSEERLRSVVENVVDGIITFDEQGVIESFNPGAERLFGYLAADVIGRNLEMLIAHSSAAEGHAGRRTLRRLLSGQSELAGRRRDDTLFLMEFAASEFRLGDRRLYTGIVRDVTERKLLEEELRHRAEQLADADRRKDEFLAMLAHELRNPLAPIRNSLSILAPRARDDAELYTTWDVVDRQVEHLTRLVDDLLDVSRITSGKVELQKETTDVADTVNRAAEEARPFIDAHRLSLTVSLPDEPLSVEADPVRLTQVLNNLLNNAAKYTEPGGHVSVGAERQDGNAVLAVRDTGVGIAPEFLPRVFDLFSQQDSSLARTRGGLGVGLTLVRNLVEMHGGTVEALSDGPGKGSTFVVRLPLVERRVASLSRPDGAAAPGPGRRVLIVDDSADSAETLAILLRRFGHEVRTAGDGPRALELARQEPPDVALLDIGLPNMDGLELARRMRSDLGLTNAYLIALTGYGQDEDRRRSEAAGFDAHLVKPVDLDRLRRLLAQFVPAESARGAGPTA